MNTAITIVDSLEKDRLFQREELKGISGLPGADVAFYLLNRTGRENLRFTSKILRSVAIERGATTHLIMNVLDTVNKETLSLFPHLEYVGLTSTGWWDLNDEEHFDHIAIQERGVTVTNAGSYAAEPVAHFIADILKGRPNAKSAAVIGAGPMGSATNTHLLQSGFETQVIRSSTESSERFRILKNVNNVCLQVRKSAGVVVGAEEFAHLSPDAWIVNASGFETIDKHALRTFLETNPGSRYIHEAWPDVDAYAYLQGGNIAPQQLDLPKSFRASNSPAADQLRKKFVSQNLTAYLSGERNPALINRVI